MAKHSLGHQGSSVQYASRQDQVSSQGSEGLPQKIIGFSKGSGEADRSASICLSGGSNRQSFTQINELVSKTHGQEIQEGRSLQDSSGSCLGCLKVAPPGDSIKIPSIEAPSSFSGNLHRCLKGGLGHSRLFRSMSERPLVSPIYDLPYQHLRTSDCLHRLEETYSEERHSHSSALRQYDGCQLPKQIRFIQVGSSQQLDPQYPLTFTEEESVLTACHIARVRNVVADGLSRNKPLSSEWSLDRASFRWLCNQVFRPKIDLFATRENHQLPMYVSPIPDPLATATDALSLNWNQWESLYIFLPSSLLLRILSLLEDYRGGSF